MSTDGPMWSCPAPASGPADQILLAHGEGGRLSRQLIRERILAKFPRTEKVEFADSAALSPSSRKLAFCTDGYIVTPIFFPGGDIGALSIHGTANDLVVSGARPKWMSVSFVIEEGFPLSEFDRVLASMADAAESIGVSIVTGDTKVASRGAVDKLFVTTAGIGELVDPVPPGPCSLIEGDAIIISGPIGRHGIAILCSREQLAFDPPPQSDVANLFPAAEALRQARICVKAMRDATRGGLAAVLHEWAEASRKTLTLDQHDIPTSPEVRGVSELLGIDPVFLACEGVMAVAVRNEDALRAVDALRSTEVASGAVVIGRVESQASAPVITVGPFGNRRPLDEPLLPAMPRIC